MFTGIVEETGEILDVRADEGGRRLRIGADIDCERGQSVSVSGVCLTVEDHADGWFEVFTAAETLNRTYLGDLAAGETVNVERALAADGRFDGHVVQGHVDTTSVVRTVDRVGEDWRFTFDLPGEYGRYIVEKGSVALDGISLTVADVGADTFDVAIIPETYRVTTLSEKAAGDPVHVEADVLAKYIEALC